jgi:3-hydroxyisobutyrate dehydrogenase-like beta-hydroxyacid dehydrogenase
MGHGMAKNLLKKGHPLSFLVHRNRSNLADLLALRAREMKTPSELAGESDVIVLCVTGTPQVEANVYGANGLLAGCRKGQIVIDTSTAMPESTDRIRADFEAKGARFVDAPLARTPLQAEEGKLNCMVGAEPEVFAAVKPVLEKFCENIFHVGGPGAGHRVKLVYNFVAMAHAAITCEALAACAGVGLSAEKFFQLVSAGGANSNMFQMVVPKALKGELDGLLFTLGNAKKDIGYYQQMVAAAPLAGPMGAALHQVLVQANALGLGEKFVPSLIEAYERINGLKIVKR